RERSASRQVAAQAPIDLTRRPARWQAATRPRRSPRSPTESPRTSVAACDLPRRPGLSYTIIMCQGGKAGTGERRRSATISASYTKNDRQRDLVRPSARAHHPLPDRDVGEVLLLRDARAARLLH